MKLRFGSLVVGAVGKAGGQCIQRHGAQYVLRNITNPTQTLQTRSNPVRAINAYVWSQWKLLTEEQRLQYAALASEVPAYDYWGDPKVLSPRQVFSKLSLVTMRAENQLYDLSLFTRLVTAGRFYDFNIQVSTSRLTYAQENLANFIYRELFALKLSSIAVNPKPYKMKSIFIGLESSPTPEFLWSQLVKSFGVPQRGDIYAIGFRAASFDAIWNPMTIQKIVVF